METAGGSSREGEGKSVSFTLTLPRPLYDRIMAEVPKTGALGVQGRIRQILAEHYAARAAGPE